MGDVFEFGCSLVGLGYVHVHLVAIEVSIVGGADRQVESEGVVGQDADSVTHHTHSVEGGLSVEQNVVSVLQSPFHYCAIRYKFLDLLGAVVYFDEIDNLFLLFSVLGWFDDVLDFTLFAELNHSAVVDLVDLFGDGEGGCYFLGDSQLIKGQVGIGADHTSG